MFDPKNLLISAGSLWLPRAKFQSKSASIPSLDNARLGMVLVMTIIGNSNLGQPDLVTMHRTTKLNPHRSA